MRSKAFMYADFLDLIELLNKHKAKYLVVGGYAVGFHSQGRATKDLDLLILPAPANAKAVFSALKEFGAPLRTKAAPSETDRFAARRVISAKDFEEEDSWFMMGTPPVAVDILTKIPGVTFNAAWKNRVTVTLETVRGLTAEVISRDDLITAKLASGRDQDLADVAALRAAQASAAQGVTEPKKTKPRLPRAKLKPKKQRRP
jgi:hypothetical protein